MMDQEKHHKGNNDQNLNINLFVHMVGMDDVKAMLTLLTAIKQTGDTMNAALQAHLDNQNAFNQKVSDGVDQANAALTGLASDIQMLNDKIAAIQASAGTLSPEDQAALDAADAAGVAAGGKLDAFTAALKTLDDLTPPVVDPAVVSP